MARMNNMGSVHLVPMPESTPVTLQDIVLVPMPESTPVTLQDIVKEAIAKGVMLCPELIPHLNSGVTQFDINAMRCLGVVCGKYTRCFPDENDATNAMRRDEMRHATRVIDDELNFRTMPDNDGVRRIEMPAREEEHIRIENLQRSDVGRWVEYRELRNEGMHQRGRLKNWNEHYIFVVYNSNEDWENFMNYTGAATRPENLFWSTPPGGGP